MSTQASALFRMSSLFFGIFFLMLGMMLLGMGLAIKVPSLYGEGISGIILSIHYVGLIVGAIRSRDLIDRVGHIRAFAAYATILSAAVIFHALVEDQFVWMLLRLIFGLCFGGLVAIFESWISDAAEPSQRGFVVSFYQFAHLLGPSARHAMRQPGRHRRQCCVPDGQCCLVCVFGAHRVDAFDSACA